ncbi:MAG: HU family DNA-binding protein [Spirochaetaceae bacterium]|jgi:predicted histone-like DNA-binding protein|nr:HU family DNA-binding protein [Spirochaetaceae bacterium]
MALWLKKIQRKNPQNLAQSKWYLTQEKSGTVGIKAIAKEIEGRSALSLGDVQSVLSNLVEVLPVFLKLGQSVNLEGFGSFRVAVSSEGTATPEELNARHIKGAKLRFLPSAGLRRNLEGITFEVPAETTGTTKA